MDYEKIGDTLIDQQAVLQKRYKIHFSKYQSTVKLLGYLSKMKNYEKEYIRVKDKLFIMRKEILVEFTNIITDDDKKYLLINPCLCKEFKQGINSFEQLKNYMIYNYRRKLYLTLDADNTINKIKEVLDEIVKQDNYFDIYNETIGSLLETNVSFMNLMKKKFSDYIYF